MIKLALKNLYWKRKRYKMMAIAIVLGFAILSIIDGLSMGVLNTIQEKAARYFAGHVSISGFTASGLMNITNADEVIAKIKNLKGTDILSKRASYNRNDAKLFFNGETVNQRKITGIDFETEYKYISKLAMDEGSIDNMLGESGKNGILISRAAAKILGAKTGDSIEILLYTDSNQYTSATLLVKGIFNEVSLFGYNTYLRIEDLNEILGREKSAVSEIAVFLKRGSNLDIFAKEAYTIISKDYFTYEPFLDRVTRDKTITKGFKEDTIVIMNLNSQLAQITDLLDAITIVSYFVIVVFVLIVMAGILNTYRVLVYERTKEIGTMRALGTRKRIVLSMFMEEAAILAIVSIIVGFLLSLLIMSGIGLIDFSFIPGAGIVTEAGHLLFYIKPIHLLINVCLMLFAVMLAAFKPAKDAAFISPSEAMRNIN